MKRAMSCGKLGVAMFVFGMIGGWIFAPPVRAELETDFVTATNSVSTNYFVGKVGIGTTTPSQTLEVAGDGRFQGSLSIVSNLVVGTGTATGQRAVAEGDATTASGEDSHAEGCATHAEGTYSHAEGHSTYATGNDGSHAEGAQTIASGLDSHAECKSTIASGWNSHAEGIVTIASGQNSHAEGGWTTAEGTYSHTEGYNTYAVSNRSASHAEGDSTSVLNDAAHAEGYHTCAEGWASHAEGFYTYARGRASHAAGEDANATNENTFVWSDGTSFGSTDSCQFSVNAANGFRLLSNTDAVCLLRGRWKIAAQGDLGMGTYTNGWSEGL